MTNPRAKIEKTLGEWGKLEHQECTDACMEKDMEREMVDSIEALLQDQVKDFITKTWGERCKTKDLDDFPDEDLENKLARCPICEVWEYYDGWLAELTSKEEK